MKLQLPRSIVILGALAILLLMVLWMSGVLSDRIKPGLLPVADASIPPGFEPLTIAAKLTPSYETVSATLQARETTVLAAQILARINKINVRAGAVVKQGDLLVTLETADLRSRLAQAEEQLAAQTARLNDAEKQFKRARELQQRGLLATADLDTASANFQTLQAQQAAAQQQVKEAQATLSYSEIYAPIDGRVVERFSEPGELAAPGQKLLSIYNPRSLRVEAPVREMLAVSLQQGQTLKVIVPALGREVNAQIEERVPAADPGSRTFMVKARVDYDETLMPGMYAQLFIPAEEYWQISIPAASVSRVGQLQSVLVLDNNQIQRRFIRLGNTLADGTVVVSSGLQNGDILIAPTGS